MRLFQGARLILGVVLACSWSACSSVPDVVFGEPDGSADGAPLDGGVDASIDRTPPPSYSCPGNAAPGSVCCGNTMCVGCMMADCTKCTAQACPASEVCCPAGASGNIQCRTACN